MENNFNLNLSLKEKLEVINNNLNDSLNIIINKIMEFMNDKCLRNKNQKNNSDIIVYDFELKIGSIQNEIIH